MHNTITGETQLTGIFGYPVAHSLSPAMHNAAFAALGLDWVYLPLPVSPAKLADAMRGFRALNFCGASVTVPHKQAVIPLLDDVTEEARVMGAVNTIVRNGDRLIGDNTDWQGFLADLHATGFDPAGKHCAITGAGGAARAVLYALARAGAESVTIFNRTLSRAQSLADDLQAVFPHTALHVRPLEYLPAHQNRSVSALSLVVNTTTLGMWPHTERSPWPDDTPMPSHWLVYDLVYNPPVTQLLRQAEKAGCRTANGLGMLVHQGAIAFQKWTGQHPPADIMYAVIRERLHAT